MRFKSKYVRMTDLCPQIVLALMVCDRIYQQHADFQEFIGEWEFDNTMVVTSLNDGSHGRNSWHYKGRAADLRTHNVKNPQELFDTIKAELDRDFDVVYEGHGTDNAHIHLEYDPKLP